MLNLWEDHMRRFIKSTMEEGRLTSFAEYGKTTDNSGSPAVLFLSESPTKAGIEPITGGSRMRIKGFPQLQRLTDKARAARFAVSEQKDIKEKIARNRNLIASLMDTEAFKKAQPGEFSELNKCESEESYSLQRKLHFSTVYT